ILSVDDDDRMPPPESKLSLSDEEKDLIRLWIAQGAEWQGHWAFEARGEPVPPTLSDKSRVKNDVDRFLLAQLHERELDFRQPASREKLIRRVTFDLTGLPPTLAEIDAFLADSSSDAFGNVVDRLLASPHFGQRMASDWLDVARYSYTYGYQVDRDRFVWPYRDWVIRAFNENKPYDVFAIEQLAGDLLEQASQNQILATTFNRLHPQKVEGGSVEEEFRVEYVADRTQTFATAFLGLTLECARCHDHKFDPISQKEYYQLFSFFNNIDESGLYSFFTNSVPTPTLGLTDAALDLRLQETQAEIKRVRQDSPTLDMAAAFALGNTTLAMPIEEVDFSTVALGANEKVEGPAGQPGVKLTGDDAVTLKSGNFVRYQPFSVALTIKTPDVKDRAVVFHRSRAWTDAGSRGYQLLIEDGKLSASLIHFWPGNAIRVVTEDSIPVDQWIDVALIYDGSLRAEGLKIYVDGQPQQLKVVRDQLSKPITGGGGDTIAIGERFRDRGFRGGSVTSFSVFDRQISQLQIQAIHSPGILDALKKSIEEGTLSNSQKQLLEEHFRLNHSEIYSQYLVDLRASREKFCQAENAVTEIMVMRELSVPRPAFLLDRGLYNLPLDQVEMQTPEALPAWDNSLPRNRLGLAKWITDPQHPLTARVAVNHYWQLVFGRGLVETPEDFGRQGSRPSHPELLDWLANDFVDQGWDVKRLLRQLVTSEAYQQTSTADADLLRRDPSNEWLARGPSYRLSAEMLRDNVLAVSGLLVDQLGGPPVRPYELKAAFKPVEPDAGDGLYRRSLYTYWKRTGPAPVMMTLDAAKRDVCSVQREQTSSPLQALAMLNGPQFVEASRALSHRLILKHTATAANQILTDMFRVLTSRFPTENEMDILHQLYQQQLDYFQANPEMAEQYLGTGKFGDFQNTQEPEPAMDLPTLAAWSSVANTLINHDECVTKR
ncbi:MAG: DUF1553 domain-containing protein, partial [Pirellulaceae bacterium]|nr:DUF1553 domain-containing protein [Pirellulaceae bacterium]